jgi:hypothetical protein
MVEIKALSDPNRTDPVIWGGGGQRVGNNMSLEYGSGKYG